MSKPSKSNSSPKKLVIVVALGLGAAAMGYTTLFSNPVSKYASQAKSQTPSDEPISYSVSEPIDDGMSLESQTDTTQAQNPLSQELAKQLAKLNTEPKQVPPPPPMGIDVTRYLEKIAQLKNAELDAMVREQQLRAQPEEPGLMQLGFSPYHDAPTMVSAALDDEIVATDRPVPAQTESIQIGSVSQIDKQWQARLYIHGQWHKVHKGSKVGAVSVLNINQSGVRISESGKRRWLRLSSQGGLG
ncbi:hypothetical protein BS333_21485 (plasmid) [Vibrio azureus]|uniref:Uncharacterized protein n=1 Tax=Vibrio azureus NBRC 104587 TaxID=1219077 RepID=U3A8F1_9VIBR|nr:hypothetical protein [Vibrio azureus]AUI88956.1 hypothetical protein BS333_21485 [Vibrio azureus]GAD76221.1 hypothetical protein VAZ01S_039_00460 [Vibrio azureus NBRC 104587]